METPAHTDADRSAMQSLGGRVVTSGSPPRPQRCWRRGDFVWGKGGKHQRWWPAVVITKDDCGSLKVNARYDCNVFWYGHKTVGSISASDLVDFKANFSSCYDNRAKETLLCGVHLALTDVATHAHHISADHWSVEEAVDWAVKHFSPPEVSNSENYAAGWLSPRVETALLELREEHGEDVHEVDFALVRNSCLACLSPDTTIEHPLFHGKICENCKEEFLRKNFSIGEDMAQFQCCVCLKTGEMLLCSEALCYRAFCFKCLSTKSCVKDPEKLKEDKLWPCFICEPDNDMQGLLQPRASWKSIIWDLFHTGFDLDKFKSTNGNMLCLKGSSKTAKNVLHHVLETKKIPLNSLLLIDYGRPERQEIDPFLSTVQHVKDVINPLLFSHQDVYQLGPIHLVIGSCKGESDIEVSQKFLSFLNVLSLIKTWRNAQPRAKHLPFSVMFVLELYEPFSPSNVAHIIRCLQCDPAKWSRKVLRKHSNSSLVWSNLPLVWKLLDYQ